MVLLKKLNASICHSECARGQLWRNCHQFHSADKELKKASLGLEKRFSSAENIKNFDKHR